MVDLQSLLLLVKKNNRYLMLQGLKTAIIEGHDIGGTCVNRGCVPSKALLAASGRVREMQNTMHLKSLGIQALPPSPCALERHEGRRKKEVGRQPFATYQGLVVYTF